MVNVFHMKMHRCSCDYNFCVCFLHDELIEIQVNLYYSKYLFPKLQILSNTSKQNQIEDYHRLMHLSLKGKEERERMCNLRKANDSKLPNHFIQHENIVTVSVSVVFIFALLF